MKKKNMVYITGILMIILLAMVGCKKESTNTQSLPKDKEAEKEIDDPLMTVGKTKIYVDEVLSYMYLLKQDYESSLGSDFWSAELEKGETFEEYAKKEMIYNFSSLKIIVQKAEEFGIFLTDEELDEVKGLALEFMENVSDKDKETYGITLEQMEKIYGENQLASKFFDITTNEVDTNITDEDARQVTIQYLVVRTTGKDKNGNDVNLTEAEKKNAKKKAKGLSKEASQVENFYIFAEANSDDSQVEVTYGKDTMPKEFGSYGVEMKTGEISKVIETSSGYYILYCVSDFDKDATRNKKEEIINERQNQWFKSSYTEWSKDYKVDIKQKLWDKIHF